MSLVYCCGGSLANSFWGGDCFELVLNMHFLLHITGSQLDLNVDFNVITQTCFFTRHRWTCCLLSQVIVLLHKPRVLALQGTN